MNRVLSGLRLGCCAVIALLTGVRCNSATSVEPHQLGAVDTLLSDPQNRVFAISGTPDGTLFVAVGSRIIRAVPSGTHQSWDTVALNEVAYALYALSDTCVIANAGTGVAVLTRAPPGRWNVLDISPSPQQFISAGTTWPALFFGLWATSPHDVYVSGDAGLLLHFDGARWRRDSNPAGPARARLLAVGGTDARLFAVGEMSLQRVNGVWQTIPRPEAHLGGCRAHAVGSVGGIVVFAGGASGECAWSLGGDVPGLANVGRAFVDPREPIVGGGTQPDSSVLFWSFRGDLVSVRPHQPAVVYRPLTFGAFAGAVASAGFVYLAGTTVNGGIVARVRYP